MEGKDTDIVPIQIKLERGLRKKFKEKCAKEDIHYGQWVRKQIKEYVEDDKNE